MQDISTHSNIKVSTDGLAGPYIIVPVEQLETVKLLLNLHQIDHWNNRFGISLNGKPADVIVNLGVQVDAVMVQSVLDAEP